MGILKQNGQIPHWDMALIKKSSASTFCSFEADLIRSETVEKILRVIGKKISRRRKYSEQCETENIIALYNKIFKERFPITQKEREDIQAFFLRKDVLTIGNDILSEISILQADSNKEFIRNFLEDETRDYTSEKFIRYILQELEDYPFITSIDVFGWENIEYLDLIEWTGKLYFYKDSAGSYRIFLIKENKKIIHLKEKFEQVPKILDNGLIFWVKEREADEEKKNVLPDIMDEFEDIQRSFHSQIWTLCKFDSKTDALEEIYKKEWLVRAEELDAAYSFFQTTSTSEKKGVIKVVETDTGVWRISEILQELYNKIYMWPNGFIVTERGDEETQEDSEVKKEIIIWIHAEVWDDSAYPEDKLTGKTLLGEQGVLWDMPWSQVSSYSGFNRVKFYDSTNICSIWTINGSNCYILDQNRQTSTPINWLQRVHTMIRNDFFSGVPALIEENGRTFMKVFIKETNTVRNLVELQSKAFPNIEITRNIVQLMFSGIGEECFYFHEWKLYDLKKWFLLKDLDIYEKRLFRFSKNLNVSLYDNFDTINVFLEEVRPGTIITIQ